MAFKAPQCRIDVSPFPHTVQFMKLHHAPPAVVQMMAIEPACAAPIQTSRATIITDVNALRLVFLSQARVSHRKRNRATNNSVAFRRTSGVPTLNLASGRKGDRPGPRWKTHMGARLLAFAALLPTPQHPEQPHTAQHRPPLQIKRGLRPWMACPRRRRRWIQNGERTRRTREGIRKTLLGAGARSWLWLGRGAEP